MSSAEKIWRTADHDVIDLEKPSQDDRTSYELGRGKMERRALVAQAEMAAASIARNVFEASQGRTESPRSKLVRLDWERDDAWRDVTARGGQTPPSMEAFLRQNLLEILDTQRELREGKRMSLNDQRRPTQQRRAALLEGSISNLTLIFQPNDQIL